MATRSNNSVPIGALISIILALAVGSAPVATLIALSERLTALK